MAPILIEEANHYTLSGGGIHVDYSDIGLNGQPQLTYHDAARTQEFSGEALTISKVPGLGRIATVTLQILADVNNTTFSILLPKVAVAIPNGSALVTTEGVTTIHKTPFALPQARLGQQDLYHVAKLTGNATSIQTLRNDAA